jgi:hypothetical protein
LHVARGVQELRLRFRKRHEPQDVTVTIWNRVKEQGEYQKPIGEPKYVSPELSPRYRDGVLWGWAADFHLNVSGHRYLSTFARWPDQQGCGDMQDASWSFHVAPRS